LPPHGQVPRGHTPGDHDRVERKRGRPPRWLPAARARLRPRRARQHLDALPRQGARADDEPRAGAVRLPLRRHVPGREPARGLRAPDPRRPRRRPDSVHALGRDRAALGSVRGSARRFAPAPPVRARLVGPGRDARPDRPTPLAPARGRAMSSTTRAVLFDIDGTLITTGGAGAVAWRRAVEGRRGLPPDLGAFTRARPTAPQA